MIYFIEIFNERKTEIQDFINLLSFLEIKNDEKVLDKNITKFQEFFNFTNNKNISYQNMINIMKSNIALMLYNLIEFTVSGLMDIIYDTIKNEELSYIDVNNDIQELWRKTLLKPTRDPNANYNTFLNKSKEMVEHILNKKILLMKSKESLPSGNLDGERIVETMGMHGISINTFYDNYRPDILSFIKTKRNELAHGSISFTDALRDSSIKDIEKYMDTVFSFMEDLIEKVSTYQKNKKYKRAY